ncbi:PhnA domain-containing protein [Ferruginibacter sp. SUN106]|uniref:PhnA domain-containing protein n=1 Tax=Ferruginibacter sp. SUN106 TaxID=2978348 RepID=UPI003D365A08
MSFERELQKRSNNICELCGSDDASIDFPVPFSPGNKLEHHIWICPACNTQMENIETADANHWRCLNDSIWSEVPAVKVVSWRMLHKLKQLDWVQDLLDIAYLDDETLEWAKASGDDANPDDLVKHIDCFGAVLQNGDNVVLTKTLNVKGATFNAPVGTIVRKIHLVADNAEQIEGRVNGSMIVILTKYVKKSSN